VGPSTHKTVIPFSSVAMRLGPVPAGPVHSCVGAAGRFAAVCCDREGVFRGINYHHHDRLSNLYISRSQLNLSLYTVQV